MPTHLNQWDEIAKARSEICREEKHLKPWKIVGLLLFAYLFAIAILSGCNPNTPPGPERIEPEKVGDQNHAH